MRLGSGIITIAIGLTVGNYAAQWLHDGPNYAVALERSFFQYFALLAVYLAYRNKIKIEG